MVLKKKPVSQIKSRIDAAVEHQFTEKEIKPREEVYRPRTSSANDNCNAGSIARLEVKLSHLRDTGDITDSTQFFQLEKRSYNLKREIERDEWPKIIDG